VQSGESVTNAAGGTVAALRQDVLSALRRRDLAAAAAAAKVLEAVQADRPGLPGARARAQAELGDFWSLLADPAAAYRCYTKAVELAPQEPRFLFNRATVECFLGQLEAAEQDYDRVIALRPDDAQAYLNRSDLRVQTSERNHLVELERELSQGSDDWRREVPLRYALAKEYEDLGEYELSWHHLSSGASLRRRNLQYDPRVDLATAEWIREAFPAAGPASTGDSSREPIFVLGMPRTGSTVVDRLLGTHSAIFCAGELPDFGAAVVAAVQRHLGRRAARHELIACSAQLDFAALGSDYLNRTRPRTGHTPYFTDKLPLNYLYIGLIARALPNARIVHVTRGPMATCYGMYKVLFDRGYPFSYDLQELADNFLAYRRLMAHWHASLPERIIEVTYEKLVTDFEVEVRALFEHLDLPWDPRCIEFHKSTTPVATASAAQVRRPLYSTAIGTWRHHEAELAPLAKRLREGGIVDLH
jgi:tetratricopeptide (TPR) repeat protein